MRNLCDALLTRPVLIPSPALSSSLISHRIIGRTKITAVTIFLWLTMPLALLWTQQAIAGDATNTCIAESAQFHYVNPWILAGILKVESSFNPKAVNRNKNGSVDVGIGQMNSIHFRELSRWGIEPNDLFDACTGIYVAAWHLSKQLKAHGNTWYAIGAYHSATPYYNQRYQALVYNALVSMRAAPGPKLRVPPMR